MDLKFKDNSQLRLAPFTKLEYIESTGTQYIDTGILQTNITAFNLTCAFKTTTSDNPILGGVTGSWNWNSSMLLYFYSRNIQVGSGNGSRKSFSGSLNVKYPINYINGNVTINSSTQEIGNFTQSVILAIFKCGGKYGHCQLFSLKLYNGSSLLRDFIPCKDPNGVVCLYDSVSETFFYNQGSDNFIAGPLGIMDIPESILLKTTTLYHENTPNVDGLQLLDNILNYQKTHQDEIKEYYYPTTQLWQDIITEYPDIVQYYDMNHKLCVVICEADDPAQFTDVIVNNPEVIHSLIDTGYEALLTSSGTQYIDTGFKPNQDTRVVLEFNDLNQSVTFLFGSRISSGNAEFGYINGTTVGQGARYGNQERILAITHNVKLTLDVNKTNWTLSNGNTANFNNTTFQSTVNCLLFGFNNGGTANCVSIRVYSCKIYDNNTFIRWLVPIQNNGNPCMIDLLTGTKYLNQGTGSFTYSLESKNV